MTSARTADPASLLPKRLTSLDGLRGVAAVVVLVHHSLLTVPLLARASYSGQPSVPKGTFAWMLTYTPLHLVWAGTEAVFLFFVLSGLVVTLPVLRSRGFDWVAFYPRRIVRIYGPVACALAFGVLLMQLVPRFDSNVLGHWMNLRPNSASISSVLNELMLINGTSGLVSPLWSLQWEILFSALLPLFVGIAVLARRHPLLMTAALFMALVVSSRYAVQSLFYLSLFAIGAVLLVFWDRLATVAQRLSRHAWVWPLIVVAALLCTSAVWWAHGLGVPIQFANRMRWIEVPGVVTLLLAAAFWRPAEALLDGRLFQWLGRISFSLYLVHEPIVTTTRLLLVQVHAPTWVSIAVAIPAAVGVAVLFARFVEEPFHRLAKKVGSSVGAASQRLMQPPRSRSDVTQLTPAPGIAHPESAVA